MPRHLLVFACLLSFSTAALVVGCNDGDNGGNATATETLELTATAASTVPSETGTPAPDIRQEDLTQQSGLQEFLSSSGGQVSLGSTIYADLTEDGAEDAVVPVSSGGEGGDIAMFVYGYGPSGLEELLRVLPDSTLTAAVVAGLLQVTEPVYAPGDPLCCPSDLTVTTYRWDGTKLVALERAPSPLDVVP